MNTPVLDHVRFDFDTVDDFTVYPFSIPLIASLEKITFDPQVTFFVGENGSGKSTILETLACLCGFGHEGGSRNIQFTTSEETYPAQVKNLARCIRPSWRKKALSGYFFRAESFFNVANYLDKLTKQLYVTEEQVYAPYGGSSLHAQSHGEGFLSFFTHRVGKGGFYIFDEPEAALSPQRQLALLSIIHELAKHAETQFIIATHSPILLAYPGATIYSCDGDKLEHIAYEDTAHYQITKDFLNHPDTFLKHLFTNE
jgi:predicted ATPase